MNLQPLVTTVVSGALALGVLIAVTVLLVVGEDVPDEFIPLLLMLVGVAVGGSTKVPS